MAENKPHPGAAAALSFVFNGLGQIYNGQIRKGLFIVALSTLSLLMILGGGIFFIIWLRKEIPVTLEMLLSLAMFFLGVIIGGYLGVYSVYDAYNTAKKLNQ
ncbi:MAG: hypothetical protein ACOY3D_01600 [Candidatus Omnitrophota bacterium]